MTILTILGWIALGIPALLLLLFLLTLPSVRLSFAAAGGEFKVTAHYLIFFYRLYPIKTRRKKPKKKKKEAPPPPPEEEPPLEEEEKVPLSKTLARVRPFARRAKGILRRLGKRLVIYRVRARVRVGGPDAHQTALRYAKATAFAAILTQILGWAVTLKKADIEIAPDFLHEKGGYEIAFRLRIRPVFMLWAGIQLLFAWLGSKKKKKQRRKGGRQYESAASHR